VHGIDPGGALAIATRFDLHWAYRGTQALFWGTRYQAFSVHERYLPAPPLRVERRGFLEIDGAYDGRPLALIATQFSTERALRVRELRFARADLRRIGISALVFAAGMNGTERIAFSDLGFSCVAGAEDRAIYARVEA
jgi:hypothetical protein